MFHKKKHIFFIIYSPSFTAIFTIIFTAIFTSVFTSDFTYIRRACVPSPGPSAAQPARPARRASQLAGSAGTAGASGPACMGGRASQPASQPSQGCLASHRPAWAASIHAEETPKPKPTCSLFVGGENGFAEFVFLIRAPIARTS